MFMRLRQALCRILCPLARWLARLWQACLDLASVLKPTRFSLLVLLSGLFFLLLTPQGHDVMRVLVESDASLFRQDSPLPLFYLALLLWAFSIWYWCRQMLAFDFGTDAPLPPESEQRRIRLRKYLPRILGVSAFLIVARAFQIAGDGQEGQRDLVLIGITLLLMVLFYLFTAYRRRLMRLDSGTAYLGRYRQLRDLPNSSRSVLLAFSGLGFVMFLWFSVRPDQATLNAATLLMLAGATWVPLGSMLVFFTQRKRIPVISLLILAAILFSPWNDNHRIREAGPLVSARATLPDHARSWLRQRRAEIPAAKPIPVYLVAAEGGGIRAAWWTASVLGALQDRQTDFSRHIFAISGVSGGSLGAAVFTALQRQPPALRRARAMEASSNSFCDSIPTPDQRLACTILSQNFLSPAAAGLFYPDLTQRFLPWPVLTRDRAWAIEKAWENAWREVMDEETLARPFLSLWQNDPELRLPALLLNSTRVETGRRIITSNLALDHAFLNSEDYHAVNGHDVALSTAAHNSARFSYVSPAGTIFGPAAADAPRSAWGHLVDGGYFENAGATTAGEALEQLAAVATEQNIAIEPVVLMITNDPALDDCSQPPARRWLNETLSPPLALVNTRTARGSYARADLYQRVTALGGKFLHFGLQNLDGPAPLGWALSDRAMTTMNCRLQATLELLPDPLDPVAIERLARESQALVCKGKNTVKRQARPGCSRASLTGTRP